MAPQYPPTFERATCKAPQCWRVSCLPPHQPRKSSACVWSSSALSQQSLTNICQAMSYLHLNLKSQFSHIHDQSLIGHAKCSKWSDKHDWQSGSKLLKQSENRERGVPPGDRKLHNKAATFIVPEIPSFNTQNHHNQSIVATQSVKHQNLQTSFTLNFLISMLCWQHQIVGGGCAIDITSSEAGHSLWISSVSPNATDVFFKMVKSLITNHQCQWTLLHRIPGTQITVTKWQTWKKNDCKSRNKFISAPQSNWTVSRGRSRPQAFRYRCATSTSRDSGVIAIATAKWYEQ